MSKYAEERFNIYKSFLGNEPLSPDSSSVLSKLSEKALEASDKDTQISEEGKERDTKFARLILEKIAKGGDEWAIVIVGAKHASGQNGSMRCLLEDKRQSCKVTILRPN